MSVPRRQTPLPPQLWASGRPMAVRLLVAMLGGWGAAQLALWAFGLGDVWHTLSLNATLLGAGEYWRLVTSQLFHTSVAHFGVTLLVLYFAGREVETIAGKRPFVGLCLAAGLLGGLANCAVHSRVETSGFSAAAAAVVAAYATILPEFEYRYALMSSRRLRFRAKHFGVGVFLFGAVLLMSGTLLEIGPAGIVAGAALGWWWVRQMGFGAPFWFQRRRMEREQQAIRRRRMTSEEFVTQEIDPILEKIAREGMESLTRAERAILEEGRGKLSREGAEKR